MRERPQQITIHNQFGRVFPASESPKGTDNQQELIRCRLVFGQFVGGVCHRGGGGEHIVVLGNGRAVGPERLNLLNNVEASAGRPLHVDQHKRLQARADAAGGFSHSFSDGPDFAVFSGEQRDNTVGFAQQVGAKHDGVVAQARHSYQYVETRAPTHGRSKPRHLPTPAAPTPCAVHDSRQRQWPSTMRWRYPGQYPHPTASFH